MTKERYRLEEIMAKLIASSRVWEAMKEKLHNCSNRGNWNRDLDFLVAPGEGFELLKPEKGHRISYLQYQNFSPEATHVCI